MGKPNLNQIRNATFAAIGKLAAAESNREELTAGRYTVEVDITARMGGQSFVEGFALDMDVGKDTTRASSRGPDANGVLALLLSEIPVAVRKRLLKKIVATYSVSGELPEVNVEMLEVAQRFAAAMRQQVLQEVKGNVKVRSEHTAAARLLKSSQTKSKKVA